MTLRKLDLPPEVIRRALHLYVRGGDQHGHPRRRRPAPRWRSAWTTSPSAWWTRAPASPTWTRPWRPASPPAGEVARDLGFGAGMGLPNMKRYSDEMDDRHHRGRGHHRDHAHQHPLTPGGSLSPRAAHWGETGTMMKHSVILDYKRCRGCTTCIKNCPTEAIRVRSGKAAILNERCIDCGTCIQVCPHKAVKSVSDTSGRPGELPVPHRPARPRPLRAVSAPGRCGHRPQRPAGDRLSAGLRGRRAAEILSDYARGRIRPAAERADAPDLLRPAPPWCG